MSCSSSSLSLSTSTSRLSSLSNSPCTSACTWVNSDVVSVSLQDKEASQLSSEQDQELESALQFGTLIVEREAKALTMAAQRMATLEPQRDGFRQAVRIILRATGGKVVVTGVGKSGIIARKLSATFLSLGTPSMFLHPTEALHGDLGLLTPHRDVVIALSHSGSSAEILTLLPHLKLRKCPIIALVGKSDSALVIASDAWIDCSTTTASASCSLNTNSNNMESSTCLTEEAWDQVPAPSCSTTVALALGDALAFAVTRAKGLGRDTFAFNHPGGQLGVDFQFFTSQNS